MEKVLYRKIIRYGNHIEIYEYEREPQLMGRRRIPRTSNDGDVDLGTNRKDTLSERQLGKRRDNARRVAMVFRRLVASNLHGTNLPLLVTLTYKENIADIAIGYKDYRSFVQTLRYTFGKTFKYICVPEFQKRGAVHFHALFWGLPSELFIQERQTRELAGMWGKGFVYLKETDGHDRLSSYLAKYMAKAFSDPRLRNKKAYVASRNIDRPVIDSGPFSFSSIIDEYATNAELIKDTEYDTNWLGTCRHRHFKILNEK
jgi:hypothetical protein